MRRLSFLKIPVTTRIKFWRLVCFLSAIAFCGCKTPQPRQEDITKVYRTLFAPLDVELNSEFDETLVDFYHKNNRWPKDATEFRAVWVSKFPPDDIAYFKDLQFLGQADGSCNVKWSAAMGKVTCHCRKPVLD